MCSKFLRLFYLMDIDDDLDFAWKRHLQRRSYMINEIINDDTDAWFFFRERSISSKSVPHQHVTTSSRQQACQRKFWTNQICNVIGTVHSEKGCSSCTYLNPGCRYSMSIFKPSSVFIILWKCIRGMKHFEEIIKICPILFLHYIHLRSLNNMKTLKYSDIRQMAEHLDICLLDRQPQHGRFGIGPLVVVASLKIRGINLLGTASKI